jgi:hypothetical protein
MNRLITIKMFTNSLSLICVITNFINFIDNKYYSYNRNSEVLIFSYNVIYRVLNMVLQRFTGRSGMHVMKIYLVCITFP